MAFGKKVRGGAEALPATVDEAMPDETSELSEALFPGGAAAEDPPASEEAAAPAEAPAGGDPLAGGDLLNMFQTTQIEVADLSVVLDLAGDIDFDDLLEELHTVAAALGCDIGEQRLAA
ncbi:MAG TPA: hypothetical protein VEZ14_14125 [Dehalococcoidia bacterium]|nr:hypothetical protein [Dehalococcoidia bacterium]